MWKSNVAMFCLYQSLKSVTESNRDRVSERGERERGGEREKEPEETRDISKVINIKLN